MNFPAYHPFRSEEAKINYLSRYDERAKSWPIPSDSRMVDTAYGQTFVRISGPRTAPPLVLLPGAGSTSLQWILNIEALSQQFRTYAVDSLINTGCVGRSIYTRAITTADDVVGWLNDLFDGLGLQENINLLGASYGGWLASQYVLHASARLDKVILIAPAGVVLPFRPAYLFRTILLNLLPSKARYLRFFKWSFKDLAKMNGTILEEIADDFWESVQCFEPVNPRELPRLSALTDKELKTIQVPTLFMIGENDTLYSAQKAIHRLKTKAPQVQTDLIPNAGHDLLMVQTQMVNQKVVQFLARSDEVIRI
ncbi:MAG: alpha/beta hydrolase [Chloroflexota bacterium]